MSNCAQTETRQGEDAKRQKRGEGGGGGLCVTTTDLKPTETGLRKPENESSLHVNVGVQKASRLVKISSRVEPASILPHLAVLFEPRVQSRRKERCSVVGIGEREEKERKPFGKLTLRMCLRIWEIYIASTLSDQQKIEITHLCMASDAALRGHGG